MKMVGVNFPENLHERTNSLTESKKKSYKPRFRKHVRLNASSSYVSDHDGIAPTLASDLTRHGKPRTRVRPHVCDICPAAFTQLRKLKKHKGIHRRKKPFVCDLCLAQFKESRRLTMHMKKLHRKKIAYFCDVCQAEFGRLQKLKEHKKDHPVVKPHVCDVCKEAFKASWSLEQHKKIHTDENIHSA